MKIYNKLKPDVMKVVVFGEKAVPQLEFRYHDNSSSSITAKKPPHLRWIYWRLEVIPEHDTFTQLKKICNMDPCDLRVHQVYNHFRFYHSSHRSEMVAYVVLNGVDDWEQNDLFQFCQWLKKLLLDRPE